jgi:undecaprenol kinase/diacylglycerol kinase (ATP)
MTETNFSLKKRAKSFHYAWNGLRVLLAEEHNARIHVFMGFQTIVVGVILQLSRVEWMLITLSIGFVISMEIINSAIENLADFVSPQQSKFIKKIKDLSAASVLISALTSVVIGLFIFIPKLIELCSN